MVPIISMLDGSTYESLEDLLDEYPEACGLDPDGDTPLDDLKDTAEVRVVLEESGRIFLYPNEEALEQDDPMGEIMVEDWA